MKGPKILPSLKPDRKVHLHKRNADTGFLGKTTKCRYVTKIFLVGWMRFPSKPCSVRCISWHPWPGCHIPPMKRGDTQRKYFTVTDTGKIIENGEHWKIRHSLSFVINVCNRGIFTRKTLSTTMFSYVSGVDPAPARSSAYHFFILLSLTHVKREKKS